MGGGFYVCAREQDGHGVQWFAVLNFFRKSHAFELVATDIAGFEPNSRKGVIPVIPISCRMRSSGKRIRKEGHTREIRQPLVLIRFALNLNKENGIVATRERDFESLRPASAPLSAVPAPTSPRKPFVVSSRSRVVNPWTVPASVQFEGDRVAKFRQWQVCQGQYVSTNGFTPVDCTHFCAHPNSK